LKNFLVVGGSSGIGKALVNELEKSGHQVYATYCNNTIDDTLPNVKAQQLDVLAESISLTVPEAVHGFAYCPGSIQLKPFKSFIAVQTGFNFHSQVAASKGALEGLTKALAAELAPQIRVNAIAPSITQTPLAAKFLSSEEKIATNAKRHPLKRVGQSIDIANAARFLLSDTSAWVTGQIIGVDGGISSLRT